MMVLRPFAAALALLPILAAPVCAQTQAPAAPVCVQTQAPAVPATATQQQDLYQDALQSIAEGRRNDASRELMRLIEKEPLHAGAWLDLAMTQCALGHADEAERMFATIETRFNPSAAILRMIAEAREEGCSNWQASSTWTLSLGRGIDQNVNQGALTANYVIDAPGGQVEYVLSDDFRPKHDQYTVVTGEHTREITPNGGVGFIQFQNRRNDHLREYDSGSLFAGVDAPWRFGHWTLRTTGTLGAVSLGGKLYQRQAQLQARVGPPLPLHAGTQLNLVTGITYADFPTLTNFNSNTFELRALVTHRSAASFASASLGYLHDHALSQRPGGDRDGWFGNVLVRRRIGANLTGELGYTHQTWNSRLPYSPGLISQVREQATHVLRANLVYALDKHQSIQLEARAVANRENISIFEYNNRQLQLSWLWQGL